MKIIVLSENTSCNPTLKSEHGLSLYIEAVGKKILFDMGQGSLFAENAKKLGIDISSVDYGIISHGHYDHGGGLAYFLHLNKKAKIYLHRNAFEKHFNNSGKEIGLDFSLKNNSRLVYVDDYYEIASGLELYSCNNQPPIFKKNTSGSIKNDNFNHEIYLKIHEKKSVVITGCSHKGIINIVHWMKSQVLVGGFHFKDIDCKTQQEELKCLAEELEKCAKDLNMAFYTCHCTGIEQYGALKQILKDRIQYINCGQSFEI